MNFQSSAAYHVVFSANDAKPASVGVNHCYIVCSESLWTHLRGVDYEASLVVEADANVVERSIPRRGFRPVYSPEGDMRESFRHAIGAPYGMGKLF